MSKIRYHENCRHHENVAKAKRMLNKIEKQFGGFQGTFYCDIQLTGINDIDRKEVKFYIERHLEDLKQKIDKQLLANKKIVNGGEWNDGYEEGFYTPPLAEELQIVEALNQVYSYIWNHYPEIEKKKSQELVFTAENPEAKLDEAKRFFKSNSVIGFCKEAFVVLENSASRKLYPFTLSSHDFQGAKSVYMEYQ